MRIALQTGMLALALLVPLTVLASDDSEDVLIPFLAEMQLKRQGARRCEDVPSCVVLAQQDPENFSEELMVLLTEPETPALVRGLEWKHERPAVTQRVNEILGKSLMVLRGHTHESAQRLLAYGLKQPTLPEQERWFFALANDTEGRAVLGEYIDSGPTRELSVAAMLQYVRMAPPEEGGSRYAKQRRPRSLTDSDRARQRRYADRIWEFYLERRATQSMRGDEIGALAFSETLEEQAFLHVQACQAYGNRLVQVVSSDIKAGRPVAWREFASVAAAAAQDPGILARLIDLASTPNRVVRALTIFHLLFDSEGRLRSVESRASVFEKLKIDSRVQEQSPRDLVSVLSALLPVPTSSELSQIAHLAATARRHEERTRLLAWAGEFIAEQRRPVSLAITKGSQDEARMHLSALMKKSSRFDAPDLEFSGIRRDLIDWVISLKPEMISSREEQERLYLVTSSLSRELAVFLAEHGRWRSPRWGGEWGWGAGGCGTARAQFFEDQRSYADVKALGFPIPKRLQYLSISLPSEPEPTPQDRTVQQHRWAFALKTIQEQLRDATTH